MIDKCLKCGKCCHATHGNITKRCKYLSIDNKCLIYSHRLGATMATIHNKNFYCVMRVNSDNDYIGCPYNTNKPIKVFPVPLSKVSNKK